MQFFTGCESYDKRYDKNKPTEFFKIKEKLSQYGSEPVKYEYFVLSNPPNDSSQLKKTIEEYNLQTMSIDTIKKYSVYERVFFRETECLTRNYDEGKPYPKLQRVFFSCDALYGGSYAPGQQVDNHYYKEENFMQTKYISYSPSIHRGYDWEYVYIFGPYFGDTHYQRIKIKDIDLFYEESREKLNK